MLKISLFQLFWRRRKQVVFSQPAKEMRINMEFVRAKKLVQHNSPGRKPMIAIVLVVGVAKLIYTDALPSKPLIFGFEIASTYLRPLVAQLQHQRL